MPRLILVNDDPTQLTVVAGLLGKDGCEVVRFLSPTEARDACQGGLTADLVVSDLNMPDVSGEELLAILRGLPAFAGVPVILVSASEPSAQARARCEELLAGQGTILAPYRVPDLRKWVRSYLYGEAPPTPAAAPVVVGDFDPTPVGKLLQTGGPAFANKVVGMFFDKVPLNLTNLASALEAGDWETAERMAHSTRGSAGLVGAVRLGELARQCEEQASRHESFSVGGLEAAFAEARVKLEALLSP